MKSNIIKYILLFCCIFLISSCQKTPKKLDPKDYISYLESASNGYTKKVTTKDYLYEFQLKTAEYIAIKEDNNSSLRERINKLDSTIWFNVKISTTKGKINPLKSEVGGLSDYEFRLNYFLMDAQQHFTLLYGGKEQKQIAYHFENGYGVSPFDVMIIGYKLDDNSLNKEIEFSYEDILFRNGIIKVTILESDLKTRPILIM